MSAKHTSKREMPVANLRRVAAPRLDYLPRKPRSYRPCIGLIGCGGITKAHLEAYRMAGYRVAALCDVREEAARERQREYYPKAAVYTDHRELLERTDIDVVDIATHPAVRVPQVADALRAGKHVLSQKPFVLDLADGERLVAMAKRRGLRVAVNQNGRWAPYFSYARQLVREGVLGEIASVDMTLAWDHTWIQGTAFERLHHIVLYDFAIHWFDIVSCLFGASKAQGAFATLGRAPGQSIRSPMNAQVLLTFPRGQASLAFRAHTRAGNVEHFLVTGTEGIYQTTGPICGPDQVRLVTARGEARPRLPGTWFPGGMAGAMGELLCAIEDGREPENSGADNLRSLALCFAALASSRSGRVEVPGKARQAGPGCSTE